MRIALFATCLADALFPPAAIATVQLLERLGHEVVFPRGQTCCGQMHVNTGYQRDALPLVRRYVETFEGHEVIVAPSGSCVGSIRHQHAMVARRFGEEDLARRAQAVADRTFELSCDFLKIARNGRRDRGQLISRSSPESLNAHRPAPPVGKPFRSRSSQT